MKEKLKQTKGITLIALIITIIILLILAMVSIRLIMNQGIITKAEQGVNAYSEAEIREKINLAYSEYKMARANDSSYTMQEAINNSGLEGTTVEGNETEGWTITVPTKDGDKKYTLSGDGRIENKKDVPKMGDYVNYDPTKDNTGKNVSIQLYTSYSISNASEDKNNGRTSGYSSDQTFNVNATTDGWRILSIENGQIKLISASAIKTESGEEFYFASEASDKPYLSAVDELNAICSIYGKGKRCRKCKKFGC